MAYDLSIFGIPSDDPSFVDPRTGRVTVPKVLPSGETLEQFFLRNVGGAGETPGVNQALSEAVPFGNNNLQETFLASPDPKVRDLANLLVHNSTLRDANSPLGDNLFSALALFGAAAGGAGAFGAYGAGAAAGGAAGAEAGLAAAPSLAAATPELTAPFAGTLLEAGAPTVIGAGTGFTPGAGVLAGSGYGLAPTGFEGLGSGVFGLTDSSYALPSAAETGGLTAPVPAGAGVLSSGAATAGQVSSVGTGTGAGLLGTGVTTSEAIKLLPALLGLVNTAVSASSSTDAQGRANDAVNLQTDIAKQLFGESTPIRQQVNAELLDYLNTGTLPLPLQQGLTQANVQGRQGLEKQYRVARENLLGLTPARGGQLTKGLIDLERSRADAVGQLGANLQAQYELPLRQALFGQAAGAGSGQTATALSGLNAGTAQQVALANQATQQTLASGQAAGSLLALALKKAAQPRSTSSSTLSF